MDGGGFNTSQSQAPPQRAKGITPLSGSLINKSQGQGESAMVPLENFGEKRLGKLIKYVGVFKSMLDSVLTHHTIIVDDNSCDVPVKCIVQKKENMRNSAIEFDDAIAKSYENHHVEVVGYVSDNIDHGRVLNALKLNLVKSPWQYLAHQLEVAYQIKVWKAAGKNEASKFDGSGGVKAEGASGGTHKLKDTVFKIITEKGASDSWGCPRKDVYSAFDDGTAKAKIDAAINDLTDEGAIYNTLDDDHFKSSDQN